MPFKYFKKCLKIILLKEFRFLFILIPKNDNNSNKIHSFLAGDLRRECLLFSVENAQF